MIKKEMSKEHKLTESLNKDSDMSYISLELDKSEMESICFYKEETGDEEMDT
jgi:hypothetical protein